MGGLVGEASFLGHHTAFATPNAAASIHIIMDRMTGKTYDCYIEIQSTQSAQAIVDLRNSLGHTQPLLDRVPMGPTFSVTRLEASISYSKDRIQDSPPVSGVGQTTIILLAGSIGHPANGSRSHPLSTHEANTVFFSVSALPKLVGLSSQRSTYTASYPKSFSV